MGFNVGIYCPTGDGKKGGKKKGKWILLTCFWLCRFGDRILSSFSFSEGEAILAVDVLNLACKTRRSRSGNREISKGIKKLMLSLLQEVNPTCVQGTIRVEAGDRISGLAMASLTMGSSPNLLRYGYSLPASRTPEHVIIMK
jgi:UDP-glucose 6-dehydrogenase